MKSKFHYGFGLLEFIIASALGILLCLGIFDFFNTMKILYQRQVNIVTLQEKSRFITLFMREKIQASGNWSCELMHNKPQSSVVNEYTSNEALEKLGFHIKQNTDLLQLHECVRFQNKLQYLAVNFFVANTSRRNIAQKPIDALFIAVDNHEREELVTGMTDFQVHLYRSIKGNSVVGVRINYVLSSTNVIRNSYPGILYVAPRNALS